MEIHVIYATTPVDILILSHFVPPQSCCDKSDKVVAISNDENGIVASGGGWSVA